jgi:2,4-didehydro-3-deoxy-L-rhamnonate hydrolase
MLALGTFALPHGGSFPGLVVSERRVIDLAPHGWDSVDALLAEWSTAERRLAALAEAPGGVDLSTLRVLAPIAAGQILQAGANYRTHVTDIIVAEERERGRLSDTQAHALATQIMDDRIATGEPYLFLGASSALCGARDAVILPARGDQHDWEVELAAVIGVGGRHIRREDALGHVAGYTIANDITTRDLVYRPDLTAIGTDWLRAKNAPTFLPLGPWIVLSPFVGPLDELTITLRLNGQTMQDASTADMLFDTATLIAYASSLVELRPGDVVLTGSPAGNGMHHRRFLMAGDVMEASITGLGHQRNLCVSEALGDSAAREVA